MKINTTVTLFGMLFAMMLFTNLGYAETIDSYLHLLSEPKSDEKLNENKDLSDYSVNYFGDSSNVSVIPPF